MDAHRRLARAAASMASAYDAVVVGSGYGGAVFAARLAEAGWRVAVLERGREFVAGDFPTDGASFLREVQVRGVPGRRGARTALFQFQVERDLTSLVGCGLGGSSLINAGVALRPDPRVWEDPRWPSALRADLHEVEAGFRRAEAMLEPRTVPGQASDGPASLPRLAVLQEVARALDAPYLPAPVCVSFERRVNAAGVQMHACTSCGDCVVGCNVGAKGTLTSNYLPYAADRGAELYTEVEVQEVRRDASGWRVHFAWQNLGRESFDAPPAFVRADVVVLAAGAFGTPQILMRSARRGLSVSKQLGRRFSANGCVVGYSTDLPSRVDAATTSSAQPPRRPKGPIIGGLIDLRSGRPLEEGMIIQDAAIPSVLGAYAAATLRPKRGAHGDGDGPLAHTLQYAVTSWDTGEGELYLQGEDVRLRWPGAGRAALVRRVHETLARATSALGGRYVADPVWRFHPNRALTTPHPLGGCPMGDDAAQGAADDLGRVFTGVGAQVHDGLYVSDGSLLPGALGANPLLTITALAERAAARVVAQRRACPPPVAPQPPSPAAAPSREPRRSPATAFRFTERMAGQLIRDADAQRAPFEFVLTILWPDLDAILREPSLEVPTVGTVRMESIVPGVLTIERGRFQLLAPAADGGGLRMRHHMLLRAESGERFTLRGHKRIDDNPSSNLWHDASVLYVEVARQTEQGESRVAKGFLAVQPLDLVRQVASMRAPRTAGTERHLRDSARFVRWFLSQLLGVYGVRGALRPWRFAQGFTNDVLARLRDEP